MSVRALRLFPRWFARPLILWIAIIIPFGVLYASVYGPEAALTIFTHVREDMLALYGFATALRSRCPCASTYSTSIDCGTSPWL